MPSRRVMQLKLQRRLDGHPIVFLCPVLEAGRPPARMVPAVMPAWAEGHDPTDGAEGFTVLMGHFCSKCRPMIPFAGSACAFWRDADVEICRSQGPQGGGRAERRRHQGYLRRSKPRIPSCGTSTAGATSILPPGIAVLNTGHRHPRVMAAVAQQAEALCAHLFPCGALRVLCAAGRAAERARARAISPKKSLFLSSGAEARRERHQDRALPHQALRGHRLLRRLPRPHAHDHGAHGQGDALQARLRPVSRPRSITPNFRCPIAASPPNRRFADLDRLFHGDVDPQVGRGHRHRAGAGRGRLQRGALRFPARAAPALRRARHRADRRRGARRHCAHRQDVLHRAFGRGAGSHRRGQGSGRRPSRCRA